MRTRPPRVHVLFAVIDSLQLRERRSIKGERFCIRKRRLRAFRGSPEIMRRLSARFRSLEVITERRGQLLESIWI